MAITGFTTTEVLRGQATIIDPTSIYEAFYKLEEQEQEEKQRNEKAEQNRIDQMLCPMCKSNNKSRHMLTEGNGIFGPGYSSHVILDFYICNDCGIHYSDLNKKK